MYAHNFENLCHGKTWTLLKLIRQWNTDITMEKKGKTRLPPLSDLLGACGPKTNGLLEQLALYD